MPDTGHAGCVVSAQSVGQDGEGGLTRRCWDYCTRSFILLTPYTLAGAPLSEARLRLLQKIRAQRD
jgi:hypothetical protein